jgi:uncharacterized membrane protein YdjX (TVP38/TMEM64 family)
MSTPAPVSAAPPRVPMVTWRRAWPLAAVGALLLALALAVRMADLGRQVTTAQDWIATLGPLAPVAYVVGYVLLTVLGVPGLPFTLAAPVLFGVLPAFVIMVVGSGLSAALAFLIARHLARAPLRTWLAGTVSVRRLFALVEKHDWMVIPLVRIVPAAPFAVVNYGFGLTGIGFWRYLLWSELAMIPMNALLVLGSGLSYEALARGTASGWLLAAAAAAALLVIGLALAGRRALARL